MTVPPSYRNYNNARFYSKYKYVIILENSFVYLLYYFDRRYTAVTDEQI